MTVALDTLEGMIQDAAAAGFKLEDKHPKLWKESGAGLSGIRLQILMEARAAVLKAEMQELEA